MDEACGDDRREGGSENILGRVHIAISADSVRSKDRNARTHRNASTPTSATSPATIPVAMPAKTMPTVVPLAWAISGSAPRARANAHVHSCLTEWPGEPQDGMAACSVLPVTV